MIGLISMKIKIHILSKINYEYVLSLIDAW